MSCFCTLFDSGYLDKGIALIESLKRTSPNSYIYVLALNKKCYDVLKKIGYDFVKLVSMEEFESDRLLTLKKNRSRRSYCWTCKPFFIKFILETYEEEICTYLDSDLYFFSDPNILVKEVIDNNASIGLVSHQFGRGKAQELQNKISGKFCAEFNLFVNNTYGMKALNWWVDKCEECCTDDTSRSLEGIFGDQMYLNRFPELFDGVHVMHNQGGGVAPWNIYRYRMCEEKNGILKIFDIQDKEYFNLCFYHFHGLKYLENGKYDIEVYGRYGHPEKRLVMYIYRTYIEETLRIRSYLKQEFDIEYKLSSSKTTETITEKFRRFIHFRTFLRRRKDIVSI